MTTSPCPQNKRPAANVPSMYQHEALNLANRQIRLFTLYKTADRGDGALLSGRLAVFDQHDCPDYVALSYTWGDTEDQQIINIDGRPKAIRRNLYDFLVTWHDFTTEGYNDLFITESIDGSRLSISIGDNPYLWIDQLCIDQENTQEQTHQLQLMGEIYSSATGVLAWLGLEGAEMFQDMELSLQSPGVAFFDLHGRTYSQSSEAYRFNPYWTRLWIVQEFVLAKELTLLCGSVCLHGQSLRDFYALDICNPDEAPDLRLCQLRQKGGKHTLHDLVGSFQDRGCADSKDKIYGLVGLLDETQVDILQPDRSKSIEEVYRDFVICAICTRAARSPIDVVESLWPPSFDRRYRMVQEQMGLEPSSFTDWAEWFDELWAAEKAKRLRAMEAL